MARKKKPEEHVNHERWLVSYADFITLLFAFFVVMFASSQTDKGKQQQMSESVKKAMEESKFTSALQGILGGVTDDKGKGNAMMKGPGGTKPDATPTQAPPPEIVDLIPAMQKLKKELRAEVDAGTMEVHMTGRGLVVTLQQTAFFPSADDTVTPSSFESIRKVAKIIESLPNPIRLEGHTDSQPIRNGRFHSNWELSAARSISMMDLMVNRFDVPEGRMAIAGYADTVPIASNETDEGRSKNRRVDIVILSATGVLDQPASQPTAETPSK